MVGVGTFYGSKDLESKVDLQIQAINQQITEFETNYNNQMVLGEQYLDSIVETCLTNKVVGGIDEIYNVTFDDHYGEINFCKALQEGTPWDMYTSYCQKYADSKGIEITEIYDKVEQFNNTYADYDEETKWLKINQLDYKDNFSDFKYANPEVKKVDYLGAVGNNVVTQLIQISCNNGTNRLTIEVLWEDGRINYIVRRV